nr:unnamed protein product [Spirometra erinaceieuropaei]
MRIRLQPRRRPQGKRPQYLQFSNELAQRLDNIPIAAAAYAAAATATENASVENCWCQLQDKVQSTALAVLGRAPRQHQDLFDDNDAAITVYGPPTKDTAPFLSADGRTLLSEKTQILQRWADHFRGILHCPFVISDSAIDSLPQVETNVDLDIPPSLQETIRAVQQLSSGKAPGSDAIPAEVYKHGGPQLMDHLTALFQEMWLHGDAPQNFIVARMQHL